MVATKIFNKLCVNNMWGFNELKINCKKNELKLKSNLNIKSKHKSSYAMRIP